jgi:hypothetical protein
MLEIHKVINTTIVTNISVSNNFYNSDQLARVKLNKDQSESLRKMIRLSIECQNENLSASFYKAHNNEISFYKINIPSRNHYSSVRVKLHTTGKTGLFYVWRYNKTKLDFFTYPEKKYTSKQKLHTNTKQKVGPSEVEFHSHIPYVSGLNSKRIDWKVYARSSQLFWKKHIDHHSTTFEINYSSLQGNKEEKLSSMSFLIEKYHKDSKSWKLILPNLVLTNNSGINHYARSLEAISVF